MDKNTFELIPYLNQDTGQYIVKDYDNVKKIVEAFIEREVSQAIITDDTSFKAVKATRTDIRKKKNTITQARLHINALLLGDFNAQLKEIEDMLNGGDKILKERVDTYNEEIKGKLQKPKVITLIVKGYDEKTINKVRNYAIKQNLQVEVK